MHTLAEDPCCAMLRISLSCHVASLSSNGTSHMSALTIQSGSETTALPRVDVRMVLFSVSEGTLWVALEAEEGEFGLPLGTPRRDEALDAAAARILADKMGVEERYLEQLYTVSQGNTQSWTVTIAYLGLALGGVEGPPPSTATWFAATGLPQMNSFDRRIVEYALLRLRAKLGYTTIAFHLLPRSFSLSELQQVYESVLDRPLDKRNFRRRIQAVSFLEPTGTTRRDGSHRPARLYQFRAAHDAETYLTPAWEESMIEEAGDR
jgi:8-oxo-dGTP diphosphatase